MALTVARRGTRLGFLAEVVGTGRLCRSVTVAESFAKDFRRFFLGGLTAMLPTMITLMIIIYVFTFVDEYIGKYITRGIQWVVVQSQCIRGEEPLTIKGSAGRWDVVKGYWRVYHLRWIGLVLAFVAIYVFGRFVGSFIGRAVWRMIERAILRLPVVRRIYPYVKQVTDFLLSSDRKMEFSRVVAVEYPRRGVWSLGLVTGPGLRSINSASGGDLLTVFIPSSPTPVTGYTITVRREEVIDVPISIDDALRFTVSGGVIVPMGQQLSAAEIEQARQGILPPTETKEP